MVGTERVPTLMTCSVRMLTQPVGNSQPAVEGQRDQRVVDPEQQLVLGTVATLQLPVRTEKSAQTQPEPMLESMAVAETEHSALASEIEMLGRIVQSEPE